MNIGRIERLIKIIKKQRKLINKLRAENEALALKLAEARKEIKTLNGPTFDIMKTRANMKA